MRVLPGGIELMIEAPSLAGWLDKCSGWLGARINPELYQHPCGLVAYGSGKCYLDVCPGDTSIAAWPESLSTMSDDASTTSKSLPRMLVNSCCSLTLFQ